MIIRHATEKDQLDWDAYVLNHPDGLAYHQFAWRRAVEEAYGFKGIYLVAESRGQVQGVLPLVDFNVPVLGKTLISLPYCDAGGVLADRADIKSDLLDAAQTLSRERKMKGLEVRFGAEQELSEDGQLSAKVRMVLDLPKNSEALLAGLKAKVRSQVKKPVRDGLTVKLGKAELVEDFYKIFSENMRALGSPVHSKKWIRSVVSAFGERVRVGLVYTPDGEPAAGGIILLHGNIVSTPWASALRKFNRLNPNMLLYWTFLAFAADHGFARFDFGRSTPGEGTYRFKEQWGAKPLPLYWQTFSASGESKIACSSSAKCRVRAGVETVWSRLPISLCNVFGPIVRRFVSL